MKGRNERGREREGRRERGRGEGGRTNGGEGAREKGKTRRERGRANVLIAVVNNMQSLLLICLCTLSPRVYRVKYIHAQKSTPWWL